MIDKKKVAFAKASQVEDPITRKFMQSYVLGEVEFPTANSKLAESLEELRKSTANMIEQLKFRITVDKLKLIRKVRKYSENK